MTFGVKKIVFPCKLWGLNNRDYRLAQRKDHIKVLTHAESHQDWLLILSAGGDHWVRVEHPRHAWSVSQCLPIRCAWRPLGYVKARQVWRGSTKKLARYMERNTFFYQFLRVLTFSARSGLGLLVTVFFLLNFHQCNFGWSSFVSRFMKIGLQTREI